jgi:hypothetical protein
MAYFYFDFKDREKQDSRALFFFFFFEPIFILEYKPKAKPSRNYEPLHL